MSSESYSQAKRQFSERNRDVIMNAQSPHKWWSTQKSAVFGFSSSLRPLVDMGGRLVYESVGKANLPQIILTASSPENLLICRSLQVTCHSSLILITFAFRSSEIMRLLLDLDSYSGTDPSGMFPLFLQKPPS